MAHVVRTPAVRVTLTHSTGAALRRILLAARQRLPTRASYAQRGKPQSMGIVEEKGAFTYHFARVRCVAITLGIVVKPERGDRAGDRLPRSISARFHAHLHRGGAING